MNQACAVSPYEQTSRWQRIITAIFLAIIMAVFYLVLSEMRIIPNLSNATLTIPAVFILGVLASVSTCMATSGALFLSTIGRIKGDRIVPAITFNVGRVLAYSVFGFLLGLVGQIVRVNYQSSVMLNVFISIVMVLIGLDMLGIISLSSIVPKNRFSHWFWKIEQSFARKPKKTALFLGALTYYLPCGFSQTVQVFALGTADPWYSMLLMGVFALGTVPALLAISVTSFFTKTSWYPWFMKVVAVLIVLVSVGYIFNTAKLYIDVEAFAFEDYKKEQGEVILENGYQIVKMDVLSDGYHPNTFTVQKNIPVRWIVNGINVYGCQGFLNVPKLGIEQALKRGENIFEFTPDKAGTISFSCSTNSRQGALLVL